MNLPYKLISLMLVFFSSFGTSKATELVLRYGQLPAEGLLLDRGWKYMPGDQPKWADPGWDDSNWESIDPTLDIHDIPELWQHEVVWFRLHFSLDSLLLNEPLALLIEQNGATEIYLNGTLIGKYGQFKSHDSRVKAASPPQGEFIHLPADTSSHRVLAVRFALQKNIHYVTFTLRYNRALAFKVLEKNSGQMIIRYNQLLFWSYLSSGILIILALLHLALYYYEPKRIANLYVSFFLLLATLTYCLNSIIYWNVFLTEVKMYLMAGFYLLLLTSFILFILSVYSTFRHRKGIIFRVLVVAYFVSFLLFIFIYKHGWLFGLVLRFLVFSESFRIALLAARKQFRGAKFVILGTVSYLVLLSIAMLIVYGLLPSGPDFIFGHLAFNIGFLMLPISLSLLLATEASFTRRSLEEKLIEVKDLSEEVIFREQEKLHLKKLDEFKSHFFANLSHEFRTPLSIIRGTTEKLSRTDDTPLERKKDYLTINRSAGKLLQMVNQLLDLSRLESGTLTLQPHPVDISKFLKEVGESFSSLFESKGIAFRFTVPLHPLWVNTDKGKLEQIINNLLSNAAKFTPEGGEVRFNATSQTTGTRKGCLRMQVQDNGSGISKVHLPHVFDRFYQVDASATRQYEGTGIGLSLVSELVKLHDGNISVDSTEGKGSTFTVNIPFALVDAPVSEPRLQESIEENVHPDASVATNEIDENTSSLIKKADQSGTILIIEDNADLRQFISSYLSNTYVVSEAENGREGFDIATETMPDLIISDIMMPLIDGVNLCRMLKEDNRTSHIPVILLTAKADIDSKVSGLESGADDYLVKPFSAEELLQRVKNLIRQREKLKELFSRKVSLEPAEIELITTEEKFLHQVLTLMEENMDNTEFDIDSFSKALGMSRSGLNRKLTALTGQTPNEFIRAMRMKRAAQLLNKNQGNISEVSYMVGFNSTNYFTKCFRAYYGFTPTEFLNKEKQDNLY